jgi:hypothetical protein
MLRQHRLSKVETLQRLGRASDLMEDERSLMHQQAAIALVDELIGLVEQSKASCSST